MTPLALREHTNIREWGDQVPVRDECLKLQIYTSCGDSKRERERKIKKKVSLVMRLVDRWEFVITIKRN